MAKGARRRVGVVGCDAERREGSNPGFVDKSIGVFDTASEWAFAHVAAERVGQLVSVKDRAAAGDSAHDSNAGVAKGLQLPLILNLEVPEAEGSRFPSVESKNAVFITFQKRFIDRHILMTGVVAIDEDSQVCHCCSAV
jgi:hypothetical protein